MGLPVGLEEHRVARRLVEAVLDHERRRAEIVLGAEASVPLLLVAQAERDQQPIVILELRRFARPCCSRYICPAWSDIEVPSAPLAW